MTDSTGVVSEKMFINYNGNVGIGTTSPEYLLDLKKDITSSSGNKKRNRDKFS